MLFLWLKFELFGWFRLSVWRLLFCKICPEVFFCYGRSARRPEPQTVKSRSSVEQEPGTRVPGEHDGPWRGRGILRSVDRHLLLLRGGEAQKEKESPVSVQEEASRTAAPRGSRSQQEEHAAQHQHPLSARERDQTHLQQLSESRAAGR